MTRKLKDIQTIKDSIISLKPFLEKKYNVKEIAVFGSYVRGEQNKKSDIDILVDFKKTPTLLQFIDLEIYLSRKLGLKVDLVLKSALKPNIGKSVLQEAVYL